MLANKSQKELLSLSKSIVQPLLSHYYKGQSGKIAVIGGCEDYTGAPFFACHSAALIGSDLSHVVCEKQAAPIIKSYSPDLMIHPYLYELENPEIERYIDDSTTYKKLKTLGVNDVIKNDFKQFDQIIENKIMPKVLGMINRCDLFVIGPGMGRDPLMLKTVISIIEQIKVANKPMILDADALYLVSLNPNIISHYKKALLTPNLIEFERIANKLGLPSILKEQQFDKILDITKQCSKKLGVTIVRKNDIELIVDGDVHILNNTKGSNRRVGGQGDTLTGSLATFVNWSYHYQENYWDIPEPKLSPQDSKLLACYAASVLVRIASNKAYKRYGRALQTSNIHEFLGESYSELFEDEGFIKL